MSRYNCELHTTHAEKPRQKGRDVLAVWECVVTDEARLSKLLLSLLSLPSSEGFINSPILSREEGKVGD